MAVTDKKRFHLLTDRGITTAELMEQAAFSAKRDSYTLMNNRNREDVMK